MRKNRLFRSWAAYIALSYIILMALVAVFGYFIAPDNTSNANNQLVELSLKKPGFSCLVLKVPLQEKHDDSFFDRLVAGQSPEFRLIAIHGYFFRNDSLIAERYTGLEPNSGMPVSFACDDLISAWNELFPTQTFSNSDEKKSFIINHFIVNKRFLLGTDRFGRDFFSRLILGARVSISVGLVSVFIALLIGVSLGAIAGYFGGWIDRLLVWLFSVVWSLPTVLLVIAVTFALGRGFWQIFVAIGVTFWVDIARVVRGQVMSVKEKEYVEAAKALGLRNSRIIFRHILPAVRGPVMVLAASLFSSAILIEAGLAFLGLGVQPPVPTWGGMVKEYYSHLVLDSAYLALLPGTAIVLVVMAFMVLANELRDALDVKNN